jgi:hypothetical protein
MSILLLKKLLMMMLRDLEVNGGRGYWAEGLRGEMLFGAEMLLVWYLENRGKASSGRGLDIGVLSPRVGLSGKEFYHLSSGS